jgi:DNA-binding transcriptional ArsR family regulator
VLRIHFTAEDLARVRISEADLLWETVLSLRALRSRHRPGLFGDWRLRTRDGFPRSARMLLPLCPPSGYFADFLTPEVGSQCLDAAVEAVLSTPRSRLRRDMSVLAAERPLPGWAGRLADRDRHLLRDLGQALRDYFRVAVAPHWHRIQACADVERAARLRVIAEGGVEQLLCTLGPQVCWDRPVLEARYPRQQELHLNGRGLVLVPSFFCDRNLVTLRDPSLPPVLVFPVSPDSSAWPGGSDEEDGDVSRALAALLGITRAAALESVGDGVTTTELSRALGVTLATASEHAKVLRDAGLITTRREGRRALHAVTPLGSALVGTRPDGRYGEPRCVCGAGP